MTESKRRLDQLLVEKNLAPSRTKAQELIENGKIQLHRNSKIEILNKASALFSVDDDLRVNEDSKEAFVSRAGIKLEKALEFLRLKPVGWKVLDVGQSTGGFTDCLLQGGATEVIGVDVGHDQLHPKIRGNSRVQAFEGLNARELDQFPELVPFQKTPRDLIVMDLSFISLTYVLPCLGAFSHRGTQLLALVKPQFEVGPEGLAKGGIVRDVLLYGEVESKIKKCLEHLDWEILHYFESALPGKDGNQEFFIYAVKK